MGNDLTVGARSDAGRRLSVGRCVGAKCCSTAYLLMRNGKAMVEAMADIVVHLLPQGKSQKNYSRTPYQL